MNAKRQPTRLSRSIVVSRALEILDRDGEKGLTMRALGRELRADPMAAYHHFADKEAILDALVEAVWAELQLPEDIGEDWQTALRSIADSIRETLRRHPSALPIMASRPNLSTPGFRVVDRTLGLLLQAGLPAVESLAFVNAAAEFFLGHALTETAPSAADADDRLATAIQEAGDGVDLPNLQAAIADTDISKLTADDIFDAGVDNLIRGVKMRLAELEDPAQR